jgi:hypothetical protein
MNKLLSYTLGVIFIACKKIKVTIQNKLEGSEPVIRQTPVIVPL